MSENIILRNKLATAAEKAIDSAYQQTKDLPDRSGQPVEERTRILNAQYFMGQYAANMVLLEDLSLDTWCRVLENTDDRRREIAKFCDGIYKYVEKPKRKSRKAAS